MDTNYRNRAYRFIEKQVQEGHQVYVICPMVEESEGMDGENVIDYAERLRHELSSSVTVGILHGKMKPKEKNEIMEAFSENRIQVLVSATRVVAATGNTPVLTTMVQLSKSASHFLFMRYCPPFCILSTSFSYFSFSSLLPFCDI